MMIEAFSPLVVFALASGAAFAVLYGLYRWLRLSWMLAGAGIARLVCHLAILVLSGVWLADTGPRLAEAGGSVALVGVVFPAILFVLLGVLAGVRIWFAVAFDVYGDGHRLVDGASEDV